MLGHEAVSTFSEVGETGGTQIPIEETSLGWVVCKRTERGFGEVNRFGKNFTPQFGKLFRDAGHSLPEPYLFK